MRDLPRVRWINSKTATRLDSRGPLEGPRIVHDGMPDGIFYKPTPEVVAQMIKNAEHMAIWKWLPSRITGEK
jgi:hypothetical protein